MGLVAVLHRQWRRTWVRLLELQQADPLAERLLRTAEQLATQGDHEQSIITATAAAEIAAAGASRDRFEAPLCELRAMRDELIEGEVPEPASALRLARRVVAGDDP